LSLGRSSIGFYCLYRKSIEPNAMLLYKMKIYRSFTSSEQVEHKEIVYACYPERHTETM
jgi:hypothetical protein